MHIRSVAAVERIAHIAIFLIRSPFLSHIRSKVRVPRRRWRWHWHFGDSCNLSLYMFTGTRSSAPYQNRVEHVDIPVRQYITPRRCVTVCLCGTVTALLRSRRPVDMRELDAIPRSSILIHFIYMFYIFVLYEGIWCFQIALIKISGMLRFISRASTRRHAEVIFAFE